MAAWAKGIPCLFSLLQEEEEEGDKDEEEEEADSGLGEEEDEIDVGDNEEPVEVEDEEQDQNNEELTHVTLMYEVGSRPNVGHYETLDTESSSNHLEKNKKAMEEAREKVKREAEFQKDREDIVNFVREQEEAKIQSWLKETAEDKNEEQEIYKDYRSPFIFRWPFKEDLFY